MEPLILYRFRIRDPITREWRTTSYHLLVEEARERYGDGNYEALESTREVRLVGTRPLTDSQIRLRLANQLAAHAQ